MIITNAVAYIIWGSTDKGKTSTIRGVTQHMLDTGGRSIFPTAFTIPDKGDFECIIEHTNKSGQKLIYAIVSQGDTQEFLQVRWNRLNEGYHDQIDIAIGAARTRENTRLWWQRLFPFPNIKWFQSNDYYKEYHNEYTKFKIDIFNSILNI